MTDKEYTAAEFAKQTGLSISQARHKLNEMVALGLAKKSLRVQRYTGFGSPYTRNVTVWLICGSNDAQ